MLFLPSIPVLEDIQQVNDFIEKQPLASKRNPQQLMSRVIRVLSFGTSGGASGSPSSSGSGSAFLSNLQFGMLHVGSHVEIAHIESGRSSTWKDHFKLKRTPAMVVVYESGHRVISYGSVSRTSLCSFLQDNQLQHIPEINDASLSSSTSPELSPVGRHTQMEMNRQVLEST